MRIALRGAILACSLLVGATRFLSMWFLASLEGRRVSSKQRAEWMQFNGKLVLKAIGIRYRIEGAIPSANTLIVSNHLSYLDIVIFSAAMPCVFVAKHEIASWLAFGRLARFGGTMFVDRESRMSAFYTAENISKRLYEKVSVLVFPEGTGTDGTDVERFHSNLFEPAVSNHVPITPAAICYKPSGNSATERDVCWFGDTLFLPHLRQVLGLQDFTAVIRFGPPEIHPDRKCAAWRTHDSVRSMRQLASGSGSRNSRLV